MNCHSLPVSAYDCATPPYLKADGRMACALAMPSRMTRNDGLAACSNLGAKFPVIRTVVEQQDIDHRRRLVGISRLMTIDLF